VVDVRAKSVVSVGDDAADVEGLCDIWLDTVASSVVFRVPRWRGYAKRFERAETWYSQSVN
jgi:hypothetical protein